jgi:GTPase SAR1 family protein
MGALCGKPNDAGSDALTRQIDEDLAKENAARANEFKVLLLGNAEGGKSTLLKQLKLLYGGGDSADERAAFSPAVRHSTYFAMKSLIKAADALDIQLKSKASRGLASDFDAPICSAYTSELAGSITALWKDPGIQRTFARRHEFALSDTAAYLCENAERFAVKDFVPSDEDLLRARVPMSGIASVELTLSDGMRFVFVDVAGQRSDKKRWVHYFEDVRAVLFVAALSSFDVVVTQDGNGSDTNSPPPSSSSSSSSSSNALRLSLELFHSVARSTWFPRSALLLCLNKRDLFKEKLAQGRLLKQALPEYAGGNGEDEALAAVSKAFTAPLEKAGKTVHVFTTCALEADSVRSLFNDMKSRILSH